MPTSDVATAIAHYTTGDFTQDEIELILRSFEPLFLRYTSILRGHFIRDGVSVLIDDDVRVFALSLRHGGNTELTLRWLVKECRQFSDSELRVTVVEAFFKALHLHGWMKNYSKYLALNLKELIGNPVIVLIEDLQQANGGDNESLLAQIPDPQSIDDVVYQRIMSNLTEAECLFHDRGIVLTVRERNVIRLLSINYNIQWVAQQIGISRQRVYTILNQLKDKAHVA